MALTNFASLTADQKLVWSRELWKEARDNTFLNKFVGTGQEAIIQRVTELTKTEKGEQVIMHLLADLEGDGVQGDNQREGSEEAMVSYNDKINIDLISHGVRNKGKLSEQKTVIGFRENARDRLSFWLSNRMDQLGFLTLAGVSYGENNDGSPRTESTFSNLSFAADVAAPTSARHIRIDNSVVAGSIAAGNTAAVTATDTLSYSALVNIGTYAKNHYIKPLMKGGKAFYVCFMRPEAIAQLKKDQDFQRAVVTAMPRSMDNQFFSGGITTVDGLIIHDHRLVYNTLGKTDGVDKWGAGSDVDGSRISVCGSQALGMADLGAPEWAEKEFEYGSSQGINVDKMFGLLKPQFFSRYDKSVQDFGVLSVDHTIAPENI